jgi:hypothetical protein
MPSGEIFGGNLGEKILMKSVQPESANPMPSRTAPPGISTIMVRFVGLLFVAVVVMALAWSR